MSYRILKCISNFKEFNKDVYNQLGIGVEIQDFCRPNIYESNWEIKVKEYKEILKDFYGHKTIHGPFIDLNPISPDNLIKKVTYDKYYNTLKIAKDLNVDNVVFHSQINPWINIYSNPEYLKAYKSFWLKIFEDVGGFNKMVVIENVFEDDPIQLKTLIDYLDLPNIKICFDIGHSLIRNNKKLEDWFKLLGDKIYYIHLNWNDGLNDLHKPIPIVKMREIIKLLDKYNISPKLVLEYDVDNLVDEVKRIEEAYYE